MKESHLHAVESSISKTDETELISELAPGVPDIRVSLDQATDLWRHETTAYVDIEVPQIDPRILDKLIEQIWEGIGERGACAQVESSVIRAIYATVDDGPEQQEALQEYATALLEFLNLSNEALITCKIVRVPLSDEERAQLDEFYNGPVSASDL